VIIASMITVSMIIASTGVFFLGVIVVIRVSAVVFIRVPVGWSAILKRRIINERRGINIFHFSMTILGIELSLLNIVCENYRITHARIVILIVA
jgi:hypothetical protein